MTGMPRGTQGYGAALIDRYETLDFADKHAEVADLLPAAPCAVLDVGAGTGRDAAALAALGHRVVAVEPTEAFRRYGAEHHASPSITWVDDSLPHLRVVRARGERFALVMLTAVWMHLDAHERGLALPVLASLLDRSGLLVMAVRHGPVPPGRVMFEVAADETVALAGRCGLDCVRNLRTASRLPANRDAGVWWTRLVLLARA